MTTGEEKISIEAVPCKLGFRTEGNDVNCYMMPRIPDLGPMFLISRMPLRVLQMDPTIWEDWRAIMRRAYVLIVKSALGVELDPDQLIEVGGPEIERMPDVKGH